MVPTIYKSETKKKKKATALKLLENEDLSKTEIAQRLKISRKTLYQWIDEKKNEYLHLSKLSDKHHGGIWQSEALKDSYCAGLARDELINTLSNNPASVSPSEKRAIAYSLSMSAGLKLDKSRDLQGKAAPQITLLVNHFVGPTAVFLSPQPPSQSAIPCDNRDDDVIEVKDDV